MDRPVPLTEMPLPPTCTPNGLSARAPWRRNLLSRALGAALAASAAGAWPLHALAQTTPATTGQTASPAPGTSSGEAPDAQRAAGTGTREMAMATPASPTITAQGAQNAPAGSPPATAAPVRRASPEGRFDLIVNDAPASQVFMQIAQGSPYTMLVSPEVSGRITISLKNTTVFEALESLREIHAYDFRIAGTRIYIQPNTLQTRMFKVSYLPGSRRGTSDLKVTSSSINPTNAGAAGGGLANNLAGNTAGGNNQNNGAGSQGRAEDTAHVRTTSDSDFWRDVRESLNLLLPSGDQRKVVINPAAGVILVRALPSELRQVEQYLKAVQVNVERQVMIEAKILEVELSADSQSGVNWSAFGRILGRSIGVAMTKPGTVLQNAAGGSATLSSDGVTITQGSSIKADASGNGFYGLSFQSANFAAMLNFLDTQGKVQVLSSPRIATLNNQKAVLKVGSDELYVTNVSSSSTTTSAGTTSTPNLNLQPIFSGIALDVTPQIDSEGMVMLHVHPSITTVTEKSKNINLGSLGSYTLPLAASSVNETDSIVRVPDGQIVAIGGLMMQEQRRDNTGIQGLADLPFIGPAFRQKSTVTRKRELVILMRPTIIRDDTGWPEAGGVAAAAAAEATAAPEQTRIGTEATPR